MPKLLLLASLEIKGINVDPLSSLLESSVEYNLENDKMFKKTEFSEKIHQLLKKIYFDFLKPNHPVDLLKVHFI